MEARERSLTGIASLKIKFNDIFGYYMEISRSNLALAPSRYERKQTLVNAERFTTPEPGVTHEHLSASVDAIDRLNA